MGLKSSSCVCDGIGASGSHKGILGCLTIEMLESKIWAVVCF